MRDIELQNKLIELIAGNAQRNKTYPQRFVAKEVASAVGGSATRVGHVQKAVVNELQHRNINIRYKVHSGAYIFEINRGPTE